MTKTMIASPETPEARPRALDLTLAYLLAAAFAPLEWWQRRAERKRARR